MAHVDRQLGKLRQDIVPAALEALYQATHGLPRKVNRLAHYALPRCRPPP